MGRTYQRGQLTHTFKPVPGRRNEALDCMAYNVAALAVLNVRNWDLLEKKQNALSRQETVGQEENQAKEELSIHPSKIISTLDCLIPLPISLTFPSLNKMSIPSSFPCFPHVHRVVFCMRTV